MPAETVPSPRLTEGDVHVWEVSLRAAPSETGELAKTLSPDERARAARFVAERDRRRFIVCRGLLRTILGGYLGVAAGAVAFDYGPHGKPALSGGAASLRFNVSHSMDMALYGVALEREVGIDLEYVRPDTAIDDIAARYFTPEEADAFRAAPPGDRVRAFFRLWTRREAYLKARGHGFAAAPADVAAGPSSRCRVVDLSVGPEYAGALAVEGHDWRLRCMTWPPGPPT